MKTPYVFISYSTKDQEHADKVYETLTQQGINCWIATHDIHGGESFAEEITSAVNGCKAFVFIVSQNSDNSPHVGNELSLAFSARKKIIPFRLHEFELSKSNTYFLQQAQWIDLFEDEDLAYSELIKAVNQALESKDADFSTVKIKTGGNKKIENQIKRAYLSLEDGDFAGAQKYADQVLDINYECAEAYLVLTLCENKIKTKEELVNVKQNLVLDRNFDKALRFSQGELKTQLEEIKRAWAYNTAIKLLDKLTDERNYSLAKDLLTRASRYKDADQLLERLSQERDMQLQAETIKKDKELEKKANELLDLALSNKDGENLIHKRPSCRIQSWKVSQGDYVKENDVLFVEDNGFEYRSPRSGEIRLIFAKTSKEIKTNAMLLYIQVSEKEIQSIIDQISSQQKKEELSEKLSRLKQVRQQRETTGVLIFSIIFIMIIIAIFLAGA